MSGEQKQRESTKSELEVHIEYLRVKVARLEEENEELKTSIAKNMVEIAKLSERLTTFQALQAAFTTIAAAVAAVVATVLKTR